MNNMSIKLKQYNPKLYAALHKFSEPLKKKTPTLITTSSSKPLLASAQKAFKKGHDNAAKHLPNYTIETEIINGVYWTILRHTKTNKVSKLYAYEEYQGSVRALDYPPEIILRPIKENLMNSNQNVKKNIIENYLNYLYN